MASWRRGWTAAVAALALTACGGGGGDDGAEASCSVPAQQRWLAEHFDDWYFWTTLAPRPDPVGYADVASYFDARLYTGGDPRFPADRWSRIESTESFNRFYGAGESLGYGVAVAGLEVAGRPDAPQSPAAAAGVRRGDEVVAIGNHSTADVIAADDYSALTASAAGQTLALRLRRDGAVRDVALTAAVYALTPVTDAGVQTSPGGRRLGYVHVKDLIDPVAAPLAAAFATFRGAAVDDLVLDLRYDGGGLVAVARDVASYVAGTRGSGRAFATLLYNADRAAAENESFAFTQPADALSLPRVFVLTGRRTCSASEQIVNALRGADIDVVAIGEATCGKPVGFRPQSHCGSTYSIVAFESVNARNEGRYFDGFDPTCAVAEDFTQPQGSPSDPLLAAAMTVADTGACPAPTASASRRRALGADIGERDGMQPR